MAEKDRKRVSGGGGGGGGGVNGEERQSNEEGKERGGKKEIEGEGKKKAACDSLCSGSGLTSFLAPQWETMKY